MNHSHRVKRLWLPVLALAAALLVVVVLTAAPVRAATAVATLSPLAYTTLKGADGGQSVDALAVMDQSGTQDDWDNYVALISSVDKKYQGYRSYTLPDGVDPASISGVQVQANYRGPAKGVQAWQWKIYDWRKHKWVKLGDNTAAADGQWSLLTFDAGGTLSRYVDASTGEIRILVQAKNKRGDAALDYEALTVTYDDGIIPPPPPTPPGIWHPAPGTSWQWQLTGTIDTSFDVDMYDIDLFDTPQATIDQLHDDGRVVICYFSAGSWENWRPDADQFPSSVKGRSNGWPGEKWLDIRQIDVLGPIMAARLDLAVQKGCDGVEPDNVDGFTNSTGFPLTYVDQINYNIWIANQAHARTLSVGLKNDLDQIPDLLPYFDWALNEQCFQYDECDTLLPFVQAGKAVLGVEYQGKTDVFCPQANAMNFDWLKKNLDLDAWRVACR